MKVCVSDSVDTVIVPLQYDTVSMDNRVIHRFGKAVKRKYDDVCMAIPYGYGILWGWYPKAARETEQHH